jgi:hypothetical protein
LFCTIITREGGPRRNFDWDTPFTDVCIAKMLTIFELVTHRRNSVEEKIEVAVMNLRGVEFVGSTAYIVNGKSKRKVHESLRSYVNIDLRKSPGPSWTPAYYASY